MKTCPADAGVTPFNEDVAHNGGYLYTTNARLSSRLANQRLTEATLALAELRGRRVLDVGCGDGAYTFALHDLGQPAWLQGVDPAAEAVAVAQERVAGRRIGFAVGSAYDLPFADSSFDLVHLRGVLHHLDQPVDALREALRVAATVVVIEPNGYNPVLKLLERVSRYHIEHGEKSYAPLRLDGWITALGARVTRRTWVGLVPFFCPDGMTRVLKTLEPAVETLPLVRRVCCGQYVFVAERTRPWRRAA